MISRRFSITVIVLQEEAEKAFLGAVQNAALEHKTSSVSSHLKSSSQSIIKDLYCLPNMVSICYLETLLASYLSRTYPLVYQVLKFSVSLQEDRPQKNALSKALIRCQSAPGYSSINVHILFLSSQVHGL